PWLVASSIIATKDSLVPRPSSQSCSEVSHCASSPRHLRRGRHTCTSSAFRRFTRRSPAPISHRRSVSLLTSTWWSLAKYSPASVGPKSRYFACTSFSVWVRRLSGKRRFDRRPRPRCTIPPSPPFLTRTSSFLTQRSLIPNCCAAARCVKCLRFTSCKTFSRSRSFVLNTQHLLFAHPASLPVLNKNFLLCWNRNFSFCCDMQKAND